MKATIEEVLQMHERGFEFVISDGQLKGVVKVAKREKF